MTILVICEFVKRISKEYSENLEVRDEICDIHREFSGIEFESRCDTKFKPVVMKMMNHHFILLLRTVRSCYFFEN